MIKEKTMSMDLNDYTIIKEGEAEILMHAKNEVFYNKTQVNNRDMSIAVLRTFISKRKQEHDALLSKRTKSAPKVSENNGSTSDVEDKPNESDMNNEKSNGECEGPEEKSQEEPCTTSEEPVKIEGKVRGELKPPRVLEALSASGLRALRYAREVEGIGQVVALDNDKGAVEACQRNIKFNGSVASSKVESHLADARVYMLTHPKEFDVVDLDPYGSPSVFLDSAVQSVVDGGMLMCTATDMAVLCGGNGEVCYSKYGSYPLRGKYCHEMALRILLACIESHANRYKRYIVPVLSVQMDFYVRVFVRVYSSASAMKNTPLKLSYVYQCTGCDSFHLQPIGRTVTKNTSVRYLPGFAPVVPQECTHCGKKFNMGGPIWSAPIHDQEWVASILADVKSMKDCYPAYDRISAVLTTISEELPDVPLYLSLHNLCATLKCTSPSAVIFRSAVINAGYRISGTHVNPLGLKSDAPMEVIWDIMRCWVKNHPVKAQPADQPGSVILAKEPVLQVFVSIRSKLKDRGLPAIICQNAVNVRVEHEDFSWIFNHHPVVNVFCNQCNTSQGQKFKKREGGKREERVMEEPRSVNSPRRILSFSKRRAAASASFFDPDEKAKSGFGVSWEQGPKTSEVYGFVGSITTVVATAIFFVWAYVPEPWLHLVGIFYYPSRYWALAVPTYAMVTIALAIAFYIGLNFMSTPPPTSLTTMFDEFSREPSSFLSDLEGDEQPIEPISDIGIDRINALMFDDAK